MAWLFASYRYVPSGGAYKLHTQYEYADANLPSCMCIGDCTYFSEKAHRLALYVNSDVRLPAIDLV